MIKRYKMASEGELLTLNQTIRMLPGNGAQVHSALIADDGGDLVRWKDVHAQSGVIKYLITSSVQTKESLLSNIYNILCEAFGEGHS